MILKYEEKMLDNCTETSNDYLEDWPNLCDFYVLYIHAYIRLCTFLIQILIEPSLLKGERQRYLVRLTK